MGHFGGDHPRRQDGLLSGRVNADLINGAAADAAAGSAALRLAADGAECEIDAAASGTRLILDEFPKELRRSFIPPERAVDDVVVVVVPRRIALRRSDTREPAAED